MEVFNSDAAVYGGTGAVNGAPCKVEWIPSHGQESSVSIRIPPFGAVFFKGQGKLRAKPKAKAPGVETVKPTRKSKTQTAAAPEAPKKRGRKPSVQTPAEEQKPVRGRRKKTSAAE